jgi:hypothetical protein
MFGTIEVAAGGGDYEAGGEFLFEEGIDREENSFYNIAIIWGVGVVLRLFANIGLTLPSRDGHAPNGERGDMCLEK